MENVLVIDKAELKNFTINIEVNGLNCIKQSSKIIQKQDFISPSFNSASQLNNSKTINYDSLESFIKRYAFFTNRASAENDDTVKQIIPYVYLQYQNLFFLVKRLKGNTEKRLVGNLSLGLGGHINEIDEGENIILKCIKRELKEEVSLEMIDNPKFMGIINNETTEVGRYHLGLVYKIKLYTPNIIVKETQKLAGGWASVEEISKKYDQLENWSQILVNECLHESFKCLNATL